MSSVGSWENESIEEGRYQVVRKLAQGGYGEVYLARDEKLQRDVVLKVPRLSWLEDPDFAERYRREIQAMVNLTHLHTVRVYDIGQHQGRPFAVIEYLAGQTLAERLTNWRQGRARGAMPTSFDVGMLAQSSKHDTRQQGREGVGLPLGSLRDWLTQIADALDYIHTQGYVHRDVKPSNIMLDGHGSPYLTDFGIAKVVADAETAQPGTALTSTGQTLGTCEYMAPELCYGEQPDGRADQYALAVTVFEMLAGVCPISGPTPLATLFQHTSEIPPPLTEKIPSIPQQLSDVVARALAKKPPDRFESCGDFAAAVLAASDRDIGGKSGEKGTGLISAQHPAGRRGKLAPSPFPTPAAQPLPTDRPTTTVAAGATEPVRPQEGTTTKTTAGDSQGKFRWMAAVGGLALLSLLLALTLIVVLGRNDRPIANSTNPEVTNQADTSEPDDSGDDSAIENTPATEPTPDEPSVDPPPAQQPPPIDEQPSSPLLRTLSGHSDDVYCVAITPDGRTAVSGSNDATLRVWDLDTGQEKRTLSGHSGSVRCVAITPDGKTVVSGSKDKTLKVWDLATSYGPSAGIPAA